MVIAITPAFSCQWDIRTALSMMTKWPCDLQAINNYLSLLGWNEGTEQEVYTLDELKQKFSLDRITKSGAVFDRTKLSWMNGQHLKLLPHDQVTSKATMKSTTIMKVPAEHGLVY